MREKLTRRWQACSSRERVILVCWGLAMLALLLWFAVVSPLGKRINLLEQRIPELESRLNAMRSQTLAEVQVAGAGSASAAGGASIGGRAACGYPRPAAGHH